MYRKYRTTDDTATASVEMVNEIRTVLEHESHSSHAGNCSEISDFIDNGMWV